MADEATNQPETTHVAVAPVAHDHDQCTPEACGVPCEHVREAVSAGQKPVAPAETVDNSPETVTSVTHTTTGPRYPYHFGVEGRKYL